MSDLRKAAEIALEALDYHFDNQDDYLNWKYPLVLEAKQALRQALAQPEQEREWVGVTYDEVYEFVCTTDSYINLAKAIEDKLKEKNT